MTVSPKTQALRYRIWAYANPRGWDVTYNEVADAIGEPVRSVASVIQHAKWASRMRVAERHVVRDNWGLNGAGSLAGSYTAADIVAGRIGNEAGV